VLLLLLLLLCSYRYACLCLHRGEREREEVFAVFAKFCVISVSRRRAKRDRTFFFIEVSTGVPFFGGAKTKKKREKSIAGFVNLQNRYA